MNKSIAAVATMVMVGLGLIFGLHNIVEVVDNQTLVTIQYPTGTIKAVTEPGPTGQWFGSVTTWRRRAEYQFGTKEHKALTVRFNDGGHADLIGSIQFEMPTDPKKLIRLQQEFGSQDAVAAQIVMRAMQNAVYYTGPLMSSTESASVRRNDLLSYIDDQARNGVYHTQTRSEKIKDPVTGQDKTVSVVEIVRTKEGVPARSSGSNVSEYGITLQQLSISQIKYDDVVEGQIAEQQKAITQVQIALANSKRAEQDALTAEKQGQASAAKAKWDQETLKAKAVTAAEQERDVARLNRDQADFYKQKLILEGQGESEKRRLVMAADGALEKKLEAYVTVNGAYAEAIQNYKGNWVPTTVMGSGGTTNGATALVDLLTAKTARDLGMDVLPGGKK